MIKDLDLLDRELALHKGEEVKLGMVLLPICCYTSLSQDTSFIPGAKEGGCLVVYAMTGSTVSLDMPRRQLVWCFSHYIQVVQLLTRNTTLWGRPYQCSCKIIMISYRSTFYHIDCRSIVWAVLVRVFTGPCHAHMPRPQAPPSFSMLHAEKREWGLETRLCLQITSIYRLWYL